MTNLPIPADARLLARSAARLARSSDPVAVAEALGLSVYRSPRSACGGSDSIIVGRAVLVADDADAPSAVGVAIGVYLVRHWNVRTANPHGLAVEVAHELAELGRAATAAA